MQASTDKDSYEVSTPQAPMMSDSTELGPKILSIKSLGNFKILQHHCGLTVNVSHQLPCGNTGGVSGEAGGGDSPEEADHWA